MKKQRLTPAQNKAFKEYKFRVSEEDRYLGSVFVNSLGQARVEQARRKAYQDCLDLGMGIEHGL